MKKILLNILIVSLLTAGFVAIPKPAYAACNIIGGVVAGNGLTDCVNELLVITVMPIVGKLLQITAYLFDKALLLNLNIASFVQVGNGTTISPVEIIWRIIRDLSGMFFIFLLLMASIRMILGLESSKGVIVGIIIAGLFVNFSLFVTKVAIDASNAFTLTIYNAIAPNQATSLSQALWWGETVSSNDPNGQVPGGISSIIMEVVDVQTLFASTKTATQQTNFNVNSIVIITGGVALMLFLGIAYLAAGVMLLWRFIYLLALMAFSPIWALLFAFPQLSDKRAKFTKELIGQCLFAPIFLFTLYIALKIFTNPDFLKLTNPANSTFANVFAGSGIAPLVQYGLVLFVIYSGLGLASAYGGKGGEFGVKWMENITKWGQGAVKNAGLNTLRFAGRNTYGIAANKLSESDNLKDLASRSTIAALALKGVRSAGEGYKKNVEKKVEDRIKFAESLGYNKDHVATLDEKILINQAQIDRYNKEMADPATTEARKTTIKSAIKSLEGLNRGIKKEISEEKLRRQSNVASIDDPAVDLKTGGKKKKTILQRVNRWGFTTKEETEAAEGLAVKNVEAVLKDKQEALEKKTKERDDIKRDIAKREKDIRTRPALAGATPAAIDAALRADTYYMDKKEKLYDLIAGEKDPVTLVRKGGIIEAEAEIRTLKSNLAKIK